VHLEKSIVVICINIVVYNWRLRYARRIVGTVDSRSFEFGNVAILGTRFLAAWLMIISLISSCDMSPEKPTSFEPLLERNGGDILMRDAIMPEIRGAANDVPLLGL
jgi:hypothetical protein